MDSKTPIGYIQTYLIKDYRDYNQHVQVGEDVAGVDIFIGEKDFIHKGLGIIIIKKFLLEIAFANDIISSCIVGPESKNKVAIKAYEKFGFKYVKMVQIPEEEEPEYLMEIKKEELAI